MIINNKHLVYSTGNYIPYLVKYYNGKQKKYRCILIHTPINN